jgi:hypothetical protein
VRLPANIAQQPEIGLPADAIVKVGLLDPAARLLLGKAAAAHGGLDGVRGIGGAGKRRGDRPQMSDDDTDTKKLKGWDSDDEASTAVKQEA